MAKRRKRTEPRPVVSLEKYAGLWIAWNKRATRIIGTGRTLDEVSHAAEKAGEAKPIFEKVLPMNWQLRGMIAS